MMHVLFIAISLLSASQVFAQEQSCGSQAMMTMTKADGSKLGLFIPFAQISSSPPGHTGSRRARTHLIEGRTTRDGVGKKGIPAV